MFEKTKDQHGGNLLILLPKSIATSLAFSAFSTTLFIFSFTLTGVLGDQDVGIMTPLCLFYGGLVLLLAGMRCFRINDIFTATTSLSYAAFWLTLGTEIALKYFVPTSNEDMGIYYLAWSFITFYVWLGSLKREDAIHIHYLLWLIALVLLCVGYLSDQEVSIVGGGWFAFFSALVGWYIAAAKFLEITLGKNYLLLNFHKLKRVKNHQ